MFKKIILLFAPLIILMFSINVSASANYTHNIDLSDVDKHPTDQQIIDFYLSDPNQYYEYSIYSASGVSALVITKSNESHYHLSDNNILKTNKVMSFYRMDSNGNVSTLTDTDRIMTSSINLVRTGSLEVSQTVSEVENLTVESITENTANIIWTAPQNVDSYEIILDGSVLETNYSGTSYTFTDLEADTSYSFTVRTIYNDQKSEGVGVTVQTTTLEEPEPEMDGVTNEQDENGDYVYSWTSPTDGTVRVIVGGSEYTTVPASDGSITIPEGDMAYTSMGNPNVRLVPISSSGKEGSAVNPIAEGSIGGAKLPFTASDTLSTAAQLFVVVGPFLLLILAIYLTRVYLIPMIKKAVANRIENRKLRAERRGRT